MMLSVDLRAGRISALCPDQATAPMLKHIPCEGKANPQTVAFFRTTYVLEQTLARRLADSNLWLLFRRL
jgi:hypothetical protein